MDYSESVCAVPFQIIHQFFFTLYILELRDDSIAWIDLFSFFEIVALLHSRVKSAPISKQTNFFSQSSRSYIVFTLALQMARIMGQSGHKVILVNKGVDMMTVTTGFSKYVYKFILIPKSKNFEEQLEKIWFEENVDWFLPMNLSIEDLKFNIIMEFRDMQQQSTSKKFSTISINNIFMAENLQSRQEFLKKCQELGLPTLFDIVPCSMADSDSILQAGKSGQKYSANVICKEGKPLLVQVIIKTFILRFRQNARIFTDY